jgi:hypothetical protein
MVYKEEQFFLAKKLKKGVFLVKRIRKSLIIKQLGGGFFSCRHRLIRALFTFTTRTNFIMCGIMCGIMCSNLGGDLGGTFYTGGYYTKR